MSSKGASVHTTGNVRDAVGEDILIDSGVVVVSICRRICASSVNVMVTTSRKREWALMHMRYDEAVASSLLKR